MNKQAYNQIEDFLDDASFVAWVHETDQEAMAFWSAWEARHPDHQELLNSAVAIVKGIEVRPQYLSQEEVQQAWGQLTHRLDEKANIPPRQTFQRKPWYAHRSSFAIAAGIAALFVMGIGLLWYQQGQEVRYYAEYGKQVQIELPDSTSVTLNANSTLNYDKSNPREVWLDGEAFFKVKKKRATKKKFCVHTSDLTVQVYGTEFNVNCRKQQTQVVLEEGEVKLALKNGEQKDMKPGDLLTYSLKRNQIIEEKQLEHFELHTAWKDGTLFFEDISLREAMDKIGELYGKEILFEDADIGAQVIQLAVPTNNLDICIQAIARANDIHIESTEKGLFIRRLPTTQPTPSM